MGTAQHLRHQATHKLESTTRALTYDINNAQSEKIEGKQNEKRKNKGITEKKTYFIVFCIPYFKFVHSATGRKYLYIHKFEEKNERRTSR